MTTAANYVVPALSKHTATVIMAHGLGDRYVRKPPLLMSDSDNYGIELN